MCGAVVGTVGTGDLCDVWQSKHVHSKAEGSATAVAFPWFKKKKSELLLRRTLQEQALPNTPPPCIPACHGREA